VRLDARELVRFALVDEACAVMQAGRFEHPTAAAAWVHAAVAAMRTSGVPP